MDVKMDSRFLGKVLKDRGLERPLKAEAEKVAQRLQQATPRRNRGGATGYSPKPGATADSTRVEGGHMNNTRDRVSVWVVQEYAAPALNWRTRQGYMKRALR